MRLEVLDGQPVGESNQRALRRTDRQVAVIVPLDELLRRQRLPVDARGSLRPELGRLLGEKGVDAREGVQVGMGLTGRRMSICSVGPLRSDFDVV